MGYVIEVPDSHKFDNWSDKEKYLPHHPVLNPEKLARCVRCSMGQQNFTVTR